MIPELGHFSLILALLLALTGAGAPLLRKLGLPISHQVKLNVSLSIGQASFIMLGFITLVLCFIDNDFSVLYVAQNSNSNLPLVYRICAVWGAHEGSLLLWSLILSGWTLLVALNTNAVPDPERSVVLATLSALQSAFLLLILQTSDPFLRLLPFVPADGSDLNPLLQDPAFVLHPPFLYLGYVGFTVPFAFAMAECLSKTPGLPWVRLVRSWALSALGFLSIGITLGSWWAYYELGWGGWWFWDPVENASFMPWIIGVALIHALWVSKDRPLFRSWRLFLAMFAFMLSLIGTFLVRSGILSSVHAFATDAARGSFILGFISFVVVSVCWVFFRHLQEQTGKVQYGVFSKEALVLLGNILLVVACLTVMLGTLYPLVIEIIWQQKLSVGPPYFNAVFIPLTLPLLLLMSIAPHIHFQKDSVQGAWLRLRGLRMPRFLLFWLAVVMIIVLGYSVGGVGTAAGLGLSYLLIDSTLAKVIKTRPWWSVGGFMLAHLGMASLVIGISLSTALEIEKELSLAVGQSATVDHIRLTFVSLEEIKGSNYQGERGYFDIHRDGEVIAQLTPEKRFFMPRELVMTETSIHAQWMSDYYIALGEPLPNGEWSLRFYIKPYIRFIWLGGLLIAAGAFWSGIRVACQKKVRFHREFHWI